MSVDDAVPSSWSAIRTLAQTAFLGSCSVFGSNDGPLGERPRGVGANSRAHRKTRSIQLQWLNSPLRFHSIKGGQWLKLLNSVDLYSSP
jgi:hypothetical protein